MQIYSTAASLSGPQSGQLRKLSALTRASHRTIHRSPTPGSHLWTATLVVTLGLASIVGCAATVGPSATATAAAPKAGSLIDPLQLSKDLAVIAADSMRGRETGTADADRAAAYIGARLLALGLEPVGDSMFFQRVPLVRQTLSPGSRVFVADARGSQPLQLGEDVVPMLTLGEGQPDPRRFVTGDLVFAGYALRSKDLGRDDFTGVDLANKVVVFLHGAPPGTTGAVRDSLDSDAELSRQLARVALQQPAAMIILTTGGSSLYRELYPSLMRDIHFSPGAAPTVTGVVIPMLLFGVAHRGSPLLPSRWPADDHAQPLTGMQLTANLVPVQEHLVAYNIIARVPGTDPALRRTYVAFGAHYDHIGILPALNGDSIANGADDDGSGTVALLSLAAATVRHPMARSALFVWHVGEEKGLLGSEYFTAHPTVPLDSIVAQLNADMIGRNSRDSLFVVGPRAAPNGQSRRLGEMIDSVNASSPTPFTIDRSWDELNHPLQIYQRSDHYNYARHGIPVAFFTSGLHADYHEVSDEVSKIDFEKLARVTRLMYGVGQAVGNSSVRPR